MSLAAHPRTDAAAKRDLQILAATSVKADPELAVAEVSSNLVRHGNAGLILTFVSNQYDRGTLSHQLRRRFAGTRIIGCTTAGEIGPLGYTEGSLSAAFLSEDDFIYEVGLIQSVSRLQARAGQSFAYRLRETLAGRVSQFDPSRCFALLLIDGLCGREENVARALHDGLGGIALVGGSAGDGMRFRETAVLYDGSFYTDSAVLLVASTPHPFTTFKTQHFVSGARRLVLTGAIPEKRIATEINGLPAAKEYARTIGVDVTQLTPEVFSAHPMVVKIGGADFVRSVQKANPDGSLTFFCAIDEGIVFNVGKRLDFEDNLKALFADIEQRVGPPQLVIGCDCILRRLELVQNAEIDKVSALLREHHVVGFSSYGEQFRGIHVNQTFTGIAVGKGAAQHGE